ncbi:MAG: DUF5522 domain-containing protein [Chloroflexota bacterium]
MDDDIFDEQGALTARYLLDREYCCGNGCRNCPYVPRHGGIDARLPTDVEEGRLPPGPQDPMESSGCDPDPPALSFGERAS